MVADLMKLISDVKAANADGKITAAEAAQIAVDAADLLAALLATAAPFIIAGATVKK